MPNINGIYVRKYECLTLMESKHLSSRTSFAHWAITSAEFRKVGTAKAKWNELFNRFSIRSIPFRATEETSSWITHNQMWYHRHSVTYQFILCLWYHIWLCGYSGHFIVSIPATNIDITQYHFLHYCLLPNLPPHQYSEYIRCVHSTCTLATIPNDLINRGECRLSIHI